MQRLPGAVLDLLPSASFGTRAEYSRDHSTWHELTLTGGRVRCDRTSQTRWSADVTATYESGAEVSPYGDWVRIYRAVQLLRDTPVEVPWGVYRVEQVDRHALDGVGLTLSGLESAIQDARFPQPRTIYGVARTVVEDLVGEAVGGVAISWHGSGGDTTLDSVTETEDRWGLLAGSSEPSVAESLGVEMFFDARGRFRVVDVPSTADEAAWDATAVAGVLVKSTATDTRDGVVNLWVVTGERSDGKPPVGPAFAWDDRPGSPTFAGRNPLHGGRPGPFGLVTGYYSSPLLRTDYMCAHAADTRLRNSIGARRQVDFTAVQHPGLEAGDTVAVKVPDGIERHLVDSWVADLASGVMTCRTRTTGGPGDG